MIPIHLMRRCISTLLDTFDIRSDIEIDCVVEVLLIVGKRLEQENSSEFKNQMDRIEWLSADSDVCFGSRCALLKGRGIFSSVGRGTGSTGHVEEDSADANVIESIVRYLRVG
ncbi:hypothetical protein BJ741DRAFT_714765 [Chytriomyces cf. hyalinus JEL632]|nr:hypothetical protein BJ741DRAFT_714765 [Chytriomyces cf. hyalinus JEL632]